MLIVGMYETVVAFELHKGRKRISQEKKKRITRKRKRITRNRKRVTREAVLAAFLPCSSGRACRRNDAVPSTLARAGSVDGLLMCLQCCMPAPLIWGQILLFGKQQRMIWGGRCRKRGKKRRVLLSALLCASFLWGQSCTAGCPQSVASGLANSSNL